MSVSRTAVSGRVAVALGFILLAVAIGYAAPTVRLTGDTILQHLQKRWAPELLGGDACALAPAEDVGRLLGSDVRVTRRHLAPAGSKQGAGSAKAAGQGWRAQCGYGTGRLGLSTVTLTARTGAPPKAWEPYRSESGDAPAPLPPNAAVGDESYLLLSPGPGDTVQVRLEARRGRSAVRLQYFAPVSDQRHIPVLGPGLELLDSALSKLAAGAAPGTDPPARKAFAGCERIDRKLAERALGGELATTRSTPGRRTGGDLHCAYAGKQADLSVTVWRDVNARAYLRSLHPNLDRPGDEAAFEVTTFPGGERRMQATVRVGEDVVTVQGTYARALEQGGERHQPTEAERTLVASVVRALT